VLHLQAQARDFCLIDRPELLTALVEQFGAFKRLHTAQVFVVRPGRGSTASARFSYRSLAVE
jgi:hypothetical protein